MEPTDKLTIHRNGALWEVLFRDGLRKVKITRNLRWDEMIGQVVGLTFSRECELPNYAEPLFAEVPPDPPPDCSDGPAALECPRCGRVLTVLPDAHGGQTLVCGLCNAEYELAHASVESSAPSCDCSDGTCTVTPDKYLSAVPPEDLVADLAGKLSSLKEYAKKAIRVECPRCGKPLSVIVDEDGEQTFPCSRCKADYKLGHASPCPPPQSSDLGDDPAFIVFEGYAHGYGLTVRLCEPDHWQVIVTGKGVVNFWLLTKTIVIQGRDGTQTKTGSAADAIRAAVELRES